MYKVLKQVHPDTEISSQSMKIMDSFVGDIFERMASLCWSKKHVDKSGFFFKSEMFRVNFWRIFRKSGFVNKSRDKKSEDALYPIWIFRLKQKFLELLHNKSNNVGETLCRTISYFSRISMSSRLLRSISVQGHASKPWKISFR